MAKKNNEFAAALKLAGVDHSAEVRTAAGKARDVLGKVNRSGLDPAATQELAQVEQEIDRAETTYGQARAATGPQVAARAKQLATINTVRKLAQVLLLLLAVIVLFNEWWVALVLLVVLIVGRLIAKKWLTGQAQLLARQSTQPSAEALRAIGRPFGGLSDASGLCARADVLYWAGLDQHGQLLEQQRRSSERQMATMQVHHDEQLAEQRAQADRQKALLEASLEENQATQDALFGRPGFLGSAIRAYDKGKRKQ